MSEITCEVVKITHLKPLENSDFLELTQVYDYPVIVKKDTYQVGDKAIYFPVDAKLPNKSIFSFVWKDKTAPSDKDKTIRAIRLRGTFSMGLLLPFDEVMCAYDLNPNEWDIGQNMASVLGVEKYEPPEPISMSGDNEKAPNWFIHYTDIENMRKYHNVLNICEEVVLTEKCHGACMRVCYHENRLWIGSHRCVKKLDSNSIWNVISNNLNLEDRLKQFPGLIFFGEAYGQVQKGFNYGLKNRSDLILFDVYDISKGRYLDYDDFVNIANQVNLPTAPVLYNGPWTGFTEHIESIADGKSIISMDNGDNNPHIREGFVLRLFKERFDNKVGRVILKLPGQDYLTGKKR